MKTVLWMILGICVFASALAAMAFIDQRRSDKPELCEARGGVMIRGSSGYICVKLERIPAVS